MSLSTIQNFLQSKGITIAIIVGIIIAIIFIFRELRYKRDLKELAQAFEKSNCIVFGRKGTGKDMIFNAVIDERKKLAYANILYNRRYCIEKAIKDFTVEPNTYLTLMEDKIEVIPNRIKENIDMYISDGGIYLPSQCEHELCKKYPSLPIFYALSRHLANMNIHINTQYLGRVWSKLREQADCYIKAVKTRKSLFGKSLITECIMYDTYKSAMAELLPFECGLFKSSEEKAKLEEFKARNGEIKRLIIKQKIKNIHYDSRWGHKKIYGTFAPSYH